MGRGAVAALTGECLVDIATTGRRRAGYRGVEKSLLVEEEYGGAVSQPKIYPE
jgi:hypothetical protein